MPGSRRMFVGTYSESILFGTGDWFHGKGKGVHVCDLDLSSHALSESSSVILQNPSFLTLDRSRRHLYCVNEASGADGAHGGAVTALRIVEGGGEFEVLNTVPSHGNDPCHLGLDRTGRFLLVANYSSGSVCVLPVNEDGSLGEAVQVVEHAGSSIHPMRQTGPHAHGIEFDAANQFVFVADLGIDRVMIYRFDPEQGTLSPNLNQPWIHVAPGSGPRHVQMHPHADFAYVINELSSTMTVYRYAPDSGVLHLIQTISTLPEGYSGESTTAELQISASGKHLYASNRGHDSIAIFSLDEATGTLEPVSHENTRGKSPRHFMLDEREGMLVVANQDSNELSLFQVDSNSGLVTPLEKTLAVGSPVCVQFL